MGLFSEDTLEEKRIKEIFGGIGGTREFDKKLKDAEINNISNAWLNIKNQIKEEVKNQGLTVDKIDERTEELILEYYNNQTPEDKLKGKERIEKIRQDELKKIEKEKEKGRDLTSEEKEIIKVKFGNWTISDEFNKILADNYILNTSDVWISVQNQIKKEIKTEKLSINDIDDRTRDLVHEAYENQTPEEKTKVKEKADKVRQDEIERIEREKKKAEENRLKKEKDLKDKEMQNQHNIENNKLKEQEEAKKNAIFNNFDFECSMNEQRTGWNDQTRDQYVRAYVFIKEDYLEIFKTGFWIKSNLGSKKLYYSEMSSVDFDKAGLMHITTSIFISMRGGEKIILKFVKEEDYNKIAEKWERYRNKQFQPVVNNVSNADELLKYAELLEKGLLTQEEFDKKKRELL